MSHGKMFDFVSVQLLGLTLVTKWRNFDSESHCNFLISLDKERYSLRFEYLPWKNV